MKYVYNQPQKAITPRFIITMIFCDMVILLAILIGSRLYHNYLVVRDAKTIGAWCEQVLCVYIDPVTGIGYPATPEVVPEPQILPADADIKIEEV